MNKFFFCLLLFFPLWAEEVSSCPFCNLEVVQKQKVYEDDHIYILYHTQPILPGHCLLVPKRHTSRYDELTHQEAISLLEGIKRLDVASLSIYRTQAYFLLQKTGSDA